MRGGEGRGGEGRVDGGMYSCQATNTALGQNVADTVTWIMA